MTTEETKQSTKGLVSSLGYGPFLSVFYFTLGGLEELKEAAVAGF